MWIFKKKADTRPKHVPVAAPPIDLTSRKGRLIGWLVSVMLNWVVVSTLLFPENEREIQQKSYLRIPMMGWRTLKRKVAISTTLKG